MNWRLVLQLSLFGLAMGVATVFWISSSVEPFVWFAIFLVSAYVIAVRAPGRFFLHGLMVSVANSVWITAAHVSLFDDYIARHQREAEMMSAAPIPGRALMAMTGPLIGVVTGVVLGLFALIASRLVTRRPAPTGRRRY